LHPDGRHHRGATNAVTDTPDVTPVSSSAPPPSRTIHVGGETWRVYESHGSYDRRSRPSLIFESEHAIRRVRDFPANWSELSDEALYALSWNR
jgi:hypothetical protein